FGADAMLRGAYEALHVGLGVAVPADLVEERVANVVHRELQRVRGRRRADASLRELGCERRIRLEPAGAGTHAAAAGAVADERARVAPDGEMDRTARAGNAHAGER